MGGGPGVGNYHIMSVLATLGLLADVGSILGLWEGTRFFCTGLGLDTMVALGTVFIPPSVFAGLMHLIETIDWPPPAHQP